MRASLAALAAIALALAAHAQSSAYTEVAEVEVHGHAPWPAIARRGYLPLLLDFANTGERQRRVAIRAERGGRQGAVILSTEIVLEPGERRHVELALPAWQIEGAWLPGVTYQIALEVGGERSRLPELGSPNDGSWRLIHSVLLIGSGSASSAELRAWEEALSTARVKNRVMTLGARSVTPPAERGDVELASIAFDELPRRMEAYTSLHLAIVDLAQGLAEPARLEPLIAWVLSGGRVLFAASSAEPRELAKVAALEGWLEERFLVQELDGAREWRAGLGRVSIARSAPDAFSAAGLPGPELQAAVAWMLADAAERGAPLAQLTGARPEIPGLDQLPYRTFALLLIAFALVIGPVNFYYVHRSRRPVLLLFSIPALALAGTLLVLGYGALHQGVESLSASHSLTVLDQRARRATSVGVSELFVSFGAGAGLAPGPGTVVLPVEGDEHERRTGIIPPVGSGERGRRTGTYLIEEHGSTRLRGRFLPTRLPVQHWQLGDRSARLRLELESEGGRLRVQNGLGVELRALRLVDAEGVIWRLARKLAPGAQGELVQLEADAERRDRHAPLLADAHAGILADAPSTYAAELAANPLRDDCGLETRERIGAHYLLGVLPARAEEGR